MNTLEMKRRYLPILQEIQMKMINLEQDGLVCEICLHDDYISFGIHQFFYTFRGLQTHLSIYAFRSLEENDYQITLFKKKVKQQLGIVL